MRSYKPGEMNRSEEVKIFILEMFQAGDQRSVGAVFETVQEKFDIRPGLFFEYLGDLEKKKYISHKTIKEGEWTVSVIQRL